MKTFLLSVSLLMTSNVLAQMNCSKPQGHAQRAFSLIRSGGDQLCEYLQDHLVSKFARDENCRTPYQAAIRSQTTNAVKCLESIGFGPRSVDELNRFQRELGMSYYEYALAHGTLETIHWLKKSGGKSTQNEFLFVARNKDPQVVSYFLMYGADATAEDDTNKTALMYAAEVGSPEVVRLLIASGAKLNLLDRSFRGALHYAALKNDLAMVETLIKLGARLSPTSPVWPINDAVEASKPEIVEKLLSAGAKVTSIRHDRTLLMWNSLQPSSEASLEVAKILIRYGIDVKKVDYFGWNALHYLVFGLKQTKDIDLAVKRIKVLLEAGVDKTQQTMFERRDMGRFRHDLSPYELGKDLGLDERVLEALK